MAKAYVMARLVPDGPDSYRVYDISVYSEPHPTQTVGDVFALLYEAEGKTFAEAVALAKGMAIHVGGRRLEGVARAW